MEAKYPTLVRPKRKLCYISEKKSQSDQWKKTFTLDDVDKMFDDMAEPHPTTVLHQGSYSDSNQSDTQASPVLHLKHPGRQVAGRIPSPDEDFLDPVARPPDPQLHSYLNVSIRRLDPVKTSSPIEQNTNKNCIQRPDSEYRCVVSPIFFNSEDEMDEEPQKNPLPAQKPQCTGRVTEKRGDTHADEGLLEYFPNVDVQLKKTFNEVTAKATVKDNTKASVSATRKQPKLASAKMADTRPPAEKPAPSGKDMNAFLQKLKLAMQPNPTSVSNTPVKAPPSAPPPEPPPELEDFLILEDDAPLYITIPSRSAKNKRNQLNKTFGSGEKSPPEKGSEDSPQEEQKVEKNANKRETQAENEKVKKRRKKEKVIESDEDCDGLTNPEDPPAGEERKQPKKKKQQRRKVSLKERGEEELPEDGVDVETEKASQKSKTKAAKYNKQIRSSEDEEEIPANKTSKARKRRQAPKAVMEEVEADVEEQRDGEPAGDEDLGLFTAEKEVLKPEENKKRKQKEQSNKSGESSHEEVRALGRRRRKPTDEWWRISGSPEKPEPPQPPKKSKQKNSSKATPSAAAAKKTNQKPPAHAATATGQQRRKTTRRKKEERIEEVDEIGTAEVEQEIPDGDLDQEESSPLVLSHRDISFSSGAQVFQKVYHCSSTDKPAAPPTSPVAPKPAKAPLREAEPAKRRRQLPGSWWEVLSADNSGGTTSSSQPQQLPPQEPKSQKEQQKKSKQRKAAPKVAKVATEPPGGALVSPLKPLVPSRTVKDSLAGIKDILTSGVNTSAASAAHQINSPVLMPRPAETVFVTHSCAAPDVGLHSLSQPTTPRRKRPSDDTLRACMSGPSSMIDMENSEEMDLPSRAQSVLSAADLCAPPLKPLTLHSNDRANLAEWFQTLWSTAANEPAALTPDQFQWFFHQKRALGIQVDLSSSCFCCGKILMGSYMKKPLWVDHSATTVFHLLTSSLSVTVNGTVSRYRSGQAFTVECGQAYSIQNTLSQPAVLIFTRMLAESVD